MTVHYASKFATVKPFPFIRVLFLTFELICIRSRKYSELLPTTFALGYYVKMVVDRWWKRILTLAWPDAIAIKLISYKQNCKEEGRLVRRTVMRYVNLAYCILMRKLSARARLLLPTYDHLVTAGLITEQELEIYLELKDKCSPHYMMPLVWALTVLKDATYKGKVLAEYKLKQVSKEIIKFHNTLDKLSCYSWVNIPLAYTQMATWAVYAYLINSLLAMQYLDPDKKYENYEVDLYVPVLAILRFITFMGWLKVAESLINPLGSDHEDLEIDQYIIRNLEASYMLADKLNDKLPPLCEIPYWASGNFDFPGKFKCSETCFGGGLKKSDVVPDHAGRTCWSRLCLCLRRGSLPSEHDRIATFAKETDKDAAYQNEGTEQLTYIPVINRRGWWSATSEHFNKMCSYLYGN